MCEANYKVKAFQHTPFVSEINHHGRKKSKIRKSCKRKLEDLHRYRFNEGSLVNTWTMRSLVILEEGEVDRDKRLEFNFFKL